MGFLQIQFLNLLAILVIIASSQSSLSATPPNFPIAKPNCTDRCGNLSIPYPFGTTPECYQRYSFFVTCNDTFNPPRAFIQNSSIEIRDISLDGQLRALQFIGRDCYSQNGTRVSYNKPWIQLPRFFTVNNTANKFTIIGCDTYGFIAGWWLSRNYTTGCTSICYAEDDLIGGSCAGLGCCQIPIPKQVWQVKLTLKSYHNFSNVSSFNNCSYAFLVEESAFRFSPENLTNLRNVKKLPMVLDWAIGNGTCEEAKRNASSYACKSVNSTCYKPDNGYGYRCSCFEGYQGNPYLINGCQEKKKKKNERNVLSSKRGVLLQEKITRRRKSLDTATIFSELELQKATNNFHKDMIIGQGGFGTVYKGFLSDNRIVAVKKSKKVNPDQVEQFINEMIILSQINNRNIVKLLGCCLETEVPLLVYEFISNGSLFEHIHDETKAHSLSWEMRLKIAVETANVLAYLHSAASTPIIHRDVKSANILLDDNLTAKVSDFGDSRLVPLDQTQLSTMVHGTSGYLDPEYMQTNKLTAKSDVYSFGVVLVELLTGKTALSFARPEEDRNLANLFLSIMKQERLFEILEDNVVKQENNEQLMKVALVAKSCLYVKGDDRPSMKEVAIELEGLILGEKHPWIQTEHSGEDKESMLEAGFSGSINVGEGNSTSIGFDSTSIGFDSVEDHIVPSEGRGR
ncbi:Serine/threonine protein kinase [Handroanthus impetiginosus]|uniref:Serine/threonine protein kinase n=1 Tax=Handroanthus impetiginosus TaxID=429701 RepID=A0A2G9GUB7_9LAMI|nr:Serine/threonine protein kinase [Handroanthus impetiginosus]